MIKHLNILEYFDSRSFPRVKNVAAYLCHIQTTPKGLDCCMIITVPSVTHAGDQALRLIELIPFIATELPPLIGMDNDVLLGLASPHSHQEGVQNDLLDQSGLHGPAR